MATSKRQYEIEYVKQYQRQFMLKANRIHDKDIVDWLESQGSIQTYLKELIRKDIAAHSAPDSAPESDSAPV